MFGQIAPRYDFMNHALSMNIDRYWRRQTVRLAPPEGDSPILDLCTGTGDLALAWYDKTAGAAPIYAADFCREMLEIGEQKKQRRGIEKNLQFFEADAEALPFGDDFFQLVSVSFGLRNVADTDQGLREMVRVCRPGGKVAVLEFSMPSWQPFKGVYGWYFRSVLPRVGQWFARNEHDAYSYLPASVGEFPSGDDLCERMRQTGLEDVWFKPFTFGIASLYCGTKPA